MKTARILTALLALGALAAAATAEASPAAPDLNPCERGAHYGVDVAVGRLCLNYYWPGCNAWIEWTAIPSPDSCLYRTDGLQSSTASAGPDVQCMDVYSQTYLANGYWLVRRDSCSVQVYQCPEGYSPPAPPCQEASLLEASASASTLSCYMVYTRNDVGQYSVVRRTSCSPPEAYHCPYQGAPIEQCDPVTDVLRASTAASAPAYEPQCMYVYRETTVGPVTQVSRDSCHSETYVCEDDDGVHESDETLKAFLTGQAASPDHAALQDCVSDSLDDYIAWG